MKKLLFLSVSLFWLVACHKDEHDFRSKGQILATDPRYCACCGGWFIEIEQDTFRTYFSPSDVHNLNLGAADYPILVHLDWERQQMPCLGDEIIVTRIERE